MDNIDVLQTQVGFLERGHSDLRKEVSSLDSKMETGFMRIEQKLDTKTTTNWQPIGILIGCLTSVGIAIAAALYYPLRENMAKHDGQIEYIRSVTVPRVEHERLWREEADREKLIDDRVRRLFEAERKLAVDQAFLNGQLHPVPPR